MGLLRNPRTGRSVALGSRVLIGRGGSSALTIDSRMVSNEHASIWWEGGGWLLRDVGSRNGTRLNGRALEPGVRTPVPLGASIVFGHEEQTWVLAEAGPPVALARAEDGTVVQASGGVLCLPDPATPELMVFEAADGRWMAEGAEGSIQVRDGSPVAAHGRAWILHLPQGDATTWALSAEPLALANLTILVRVSQDEEYIEIDLRHAGGDTRLPTRAHFELLLILARARIEDAEHPLAEQGWRYAEEVQRMCGLDNTSLNLHIFRARQQLGEASVAGAAGVIERRPSTGQLRLGTHRVEVTSLGGAATAPATPAP